MFKPFFQINNHLPEAEKGVGLGLSIVHAVIALLPEHQLTVSSQPGSGSRFTLQLPLAEQTSPYFLSDKPPVQHAFTDLKGLYVLLIEDDILVRLSTAALLDFHGILHDDFSVLEELEAYLPKMERCPDLVLSDFRLPRNKTAVDALALIEEVWGAVPILVVSGDAGGQAGADASLDICHQLPLHAEVLKKPVSPERLLATISQLCGSTVRPTVPLI